MSSGPPGLEATTVRDPLLGAKLGDYEVLKLVGEGGMGVVYEGLHTVINKRIAIKVIKTEFAGDQVLVRRVLAEAQAVNAVRHRGIVDIHAHGLTPDGRPYLVMELLQGETLFDLIGRHGGKLPREEAVKLLIEATGPLIAAHKAGIVHRDLKPTNLFLCQEDDGERFLKLLDFGLAKRSAPGATSSTMTSAALIVGTPDYMAPEQARAQPTDLRTDIYSLGVLAYELLAGVLPYTAPTTVDLVVKHLSAPVPKLIDHDPSIPAELSDLVEQMMAKEPADRPQSLDPVRATLKQVLAEPSIQFARATPAFSPRVDSTFVGAAPADEASAETTQGLARVEPRPSSRRPKRPPSDRTAQVASLDTTTSRMSPLEERSPEGSTPSLRPSKTPLIVGVVSLVLIAAGLAVMFARGGGDESKPPVVLERVPVVEKPVVEKPVVEKPVVEKPVVEKPVVEKPVVEKPVVEKPVVEKPRPVVDKRPAKRAPTTAELKARIELLSREAANHPNPALAKILTKYRAALESDDSEPSRLETSRKLDEFQRTLRAN